MPDEDVSRVTDITSGSPYDPSTVDSTRERIVALYRSRGFASATVTANAAVRGAVACRSHVRDREGSRQTIGDIVISGNGGIDADVVTRALG